MSRQEDLERLLNDHEGLLRSYTGIFNSSREPREMLRARQQILDLWPLAQECLDEYRRLVDPLPDDMAALARYIAAGIPADIAHWQPGDELLARRPHLPLQRPRRADHFIDRERELAQLLADLQPGQVVTLCGPGGIGKSALAAEAIWALAPGDEPPARFPDGIVSHSFYGQPQAALALEAIARAYGYDPLPGPQDAARRALAGRTALLLLDGTEAADDLAAVLAVCGGCGVLVTSRRRRDAAATHRDIAPLPLEEAVALLQAWAEGRAADREAAEQVCRLLGGLPLAVRLAGRYLAEQEEDVDIYLDWLVRTPLAALDQGAQQAESVPLLMAHSAAQVSDPARQALAVVGALAVAPFERAAIAAGLAVGENEAGRLLGELVAYGLLIRPQERYQVSHALIHTYARQRHPMDGAGLGRLAGLYAALVYEHREPGAAAYAALAPEREHWMSVLEACVTQREWEAAYSLAGVIQDYMAAQGPGMERVRALEQGVLAARELGCRRDEGAFLGNLGNAYRALGQVEQAIASHQQALAISREIGDRSIECNALSSLGSAYYSLGQMFQAMMFHQQALSIAGETRDLKAAGVCLGSLGLDLGALGQMEEAIEYHQRALMLAREIGDRRDESSQLGNLGGACYSLGQVDQAIEYSRQALAIARETGDRRIQGNVLGNLGLAYSYLGQAGQAIEFYQQALDIARELGDRGGEGRHSWNLGLVYEETDPARAAALMSVLVDYEREIGHPDAQADAERVEQIRARISNTQT